MSTDPFFPMIVNVIARKVFFLTWHSQLTIKQLIATTCSTSLAMTYRKGVIQCPPIHSFV